MPRIYLEPPVNPNECNKNFTFIKEDYCVTVTVSTFKKNEGPYAKKNDPLFKLFPLSEDFYKKISNKIEELMDKEMNNIKQANHNSTGSDKFPYLRSIEELLD